VEQSTWQFEERGHLTGTAQAIVENCLVWARILVGGACEKSDFNRRRINVQFEFELNLNSEWLITCRTLNKWYLCKRRSLIGRPGLTCTYATADWLSAVDREYKKADATVMSSIGLGGLGRQTDRPKLIEDYSKPNSSPVRSSTVPVTVPSFRSSTVPVLQSRSPVSESTVPVPVFSPSFPVPSFPVFELCIWNYRI